MKSALSSQNLLPSSLLSYSQRWTEINPHPARSLLRLAILREMSHAVHALISARLAQGNPGEARLFQSWEKKVDTLRLRSLDNDPRCADLTQCLLEAETFPSVDRPLPDDLRHALGPSHLERQDRSWEREIAAQACQLHWCLWQKEAMVSIAEVEKFNQSLVEELWPQGILLWIEPVEISLELQEQKLWKGNWFVFFDPKVVRNENEWKLLFDPSKMNLVQEQLTSSTRPLSSQRGRR